MILHPSFYYFPNYDVTASKVRNPLVNNNKLGFTWIKQSFQGFFAPSGDSG